MLKNLLESKAKKQKRLGGSVTSVIFHAVVVVALVIVTKNSGLTNDKPKEEKVDFVEVKKDEPPPPKEKPPEGASFQGAKMPFFLRFHDGAGMHAGRLPGHPASHGCVRLPRFMAEHFFENAPLGTPVTVTP